MLSKFGNQSAQKQFIFSNKANFERGLILENKKQDIEKWVIADYHKFLKRYGLL